MLPLARKYSVRDLDIYCETSVFPSKKLWTHQVKSLINEADKRSIIAELSTKAVLARYHLTYEHCPSNLWYLALEKPSCFYDIALLLRISTYTIQSHECLCGMFSYDIVKHVFRYCNDTQNDRDRFIEDLIDILDVATFNSVWNDDDDIFLTFMLGGLPTQCTKTLEHETWVMCIYRICRTIKLLKRYFYECV